MWKHIDRYTGTVSEIDKMSTSCTNPIQIDALLEPRPPQTLFSPVARTRLLFPCCSTAILKVAGEIVVSPSAALRYSNMEQNLRQLSEHLSQASTILTSVFTSAGVPSENISRTQTQDSRLGPVRESLLNEILLRRLNIFLSRKLFLLKRIVRF